MELEPSIVISAIALVVSVISPVLTTLVNNYQRNKEFEQEFFTKHRAEVIERYINSVGSFARTGDLTFLAEYGKSYGEIFLYVDKSLWPKLDNINELLKTRRSLDVMDVLVDLCKALDVKAVRPTKQNLLSRLLHRQR